MDVRRTSAEWRSSHCSICGHLKDAEYDIKKLENVERLIRSNEDLAGRQDIKWLWLYCDDRGLIERFQHSVELLEIIRKELGV